MTVDVDGWKKVAERKQAERFRKIPDKWRLSSYSLPSSATLDLLSFPARSGFFTDEELDITSVFLLSSSVHLIGYL